MSLKTTSGSDLLYRTASVINHNAAYTILSWHRIDTDTNNYAHFQHVGGNRASYDGNTDFIGTDTDGTTFRYGSAGGASNTFLTGGALTVGVWFWLAIVRETATSLKFYIGTDNTDGVLVNTVTINVGSRTAASAISLGGYNALPTNGLVAQPRIWTKALTLAGLHAEVASATTVDTASLWSAPAFVGANVAAALVDTSGNSRDFSQDGTITLGGAEPPTFGSGPSITSTSSATPMRGSILTITGTNFGASQGAGYVDIGGTTQTVTSWSNTLIRVLVDPGTNKCGVSVNVVVTDNSATDSSPYALTSLQPQSGWSYIDLTSVASVGAVNASPPVVATDQVEYDNKSGLVTMYADGTYSAFVLIGSFYYRVWSSTGGGYGTEGLETPFLNVPKMRTPHEINVRGGADVWDQPQAGVILVNDFFDTAATAVKIWNGSSWVVKPVKVWNGSAWVTKTLKCRATSSWI